MSIFKCFDDGGGDGVPIEAASAPKALAEYIKQRLGDPDAYGVKGADGERTRFKAWAADAVGWFDFKDYGPDGPPAADRQGADAWGCLGADGGVRMRRVETKDA